MKRKTIIKNIIALIAIAIFSINVIIHRINSNMAKENFKTIQYKYVIEDIEYRVNNKGCPHIKVNGNWRYLNNTECKISDYIQIGDSISKESGSMTIKVYRKNEEGVWIKKSFN